MTSAVSKTFKFSYNQYARMGLKANEPMELTSDNDYFSTLPRAASLLHLLDNHHSEICENCHMIAIYGEWGSGKTTLFQYIEKNIPSKYHCIFFESWKYENDDNLSLSLLENILDEIHIKAPLKLTNENVSEIVSLGFDLLSNLPFQSNAVKLVLTSKKLIDNYKEMTAAHKGASLYSKSKKFKAEFKKAIDLLDEEDLIVFIDDLDRCEPENVIKLLSQIKLFFTLNEKQSCQNNIVFLVGIDKNSVKKAINIKYDDLIKSEEYLEKIFDLTFNMNNNFKIEKLINNYLGCGKPYVHNEIVCKFFNELKIKNPRKIIKLMNKYLVFNQLVQFRPEQESTEPLKHLINNDNAKILLVIFELYFIYLHEFKFDLFKNVANPDDKFQKYRDLDKEKISNQFKTSREKQEGPYNYLKTFSEKYNVVEINSHSEPYCFRNNSPSDLLALIFYLLPHNAKRFTYDAYTKMSYIEETPSEIKIDVFFDRLTFLFSQFDENSIEICFCKFLKQLFEYTYKLDFFSDHSFNLKLLLDEIQSNL